MTSLILGWPVFDSSDEAGEDKPFRAEGKNHGRSRIESIKKYNAEGHLITFAPTGAGKGVSVIIPNLLHYDGPIITIDPKGENFAVTARYRQEVLNQKIFLLDPFHNVEDELLQKLNVNRARLNPLKIQTEDEDFVVNTAIMMAELLAGQSALHTKEPYWPDQGKMLLSGLLAHEMLHARRLNREPSLRRVVDILFSKGAAGTDAELALLLDEESPSDFTLQAIASILAVNADSTRTSIISFARQFLKILISESIIRSLEDATLDLAEIQKGEDFTVYIVIPPNKLQSHSALLQIWIRIILSSVMERKEIPEKRTLFLLDECAQLGALEELRTAVTLLRGYGLQVWMFFQDYSQIDRLYKDSNTLVNNCGVVQAFGTTRAAAADPIAEVIGNISGNKLMNLDRTQQMLSVVGQRPHTAVLCNYLQDPLFRGRFDENPLHRRKDYPRVPEAPMNLIKHHF